MRPRFHTAEDSDEPRLKMVLLDEFARQGFLADIGGIQIAERSSGRLSHFNGLGLDALRQVSGKVFKVLKEEFFDRQQRLHGLGVVERWQRGPAKKNSCPFAQFVGHASIYGPTNNTNKHESRSRPAKRIRVPSRNSWAKCNSG